jgi:uncharacterized protein (DUF983 family)
MIVPQIIYSTLTNKCSRCHGGKVFENNNPYSFMNGITMKETCSKCGLKYEREPGFFYGAMYVSYALMSGILIVWFISDLLWLHFEPITLATVVVTSMLVLFPVAFRWARIIWLNFFIRYDKTYSKESKNVKTLNKPIPIHTNTNNHENSHKH